MHVRLWRRCCLHGRGSYRQIPGVNGRRYCGKSRNSFPGLRYHPLPRRRSPHRRIRLHHPRRLRSCLHSCSADYRLLRPRPPHHRTHRNRLPPHRAVHSFRTCGRGSHCHHPHLLHHNPHHIPCLHPGRLHTLRNGPGCLVPGHIHNHGLSRGHCGVHCWNPVFCYLWLP